MVNVKFSDVIHVSTYELYSVCHKYITTDPNPKEVGSLIIPNTYQNNALDRKPYKCIK